MRVCRTLVIVLICLGVSASPASAYPTRPADDPKLICPGHISPRGGVCPSYGNPFGVPAGGDQTGGGPCGLVCSVGKLLGGLGL